MPGKHILTNAQWESIEHLAQGKLSDRGRTGSCPRDFINAVLWIMFFDREWKELPARFGQWKVAHQRFIRWRAKGVWDDIFKTLSALKSNRKHEEIFPGMQDERDLKLAGEVKVDYLGVYCRGLRNKKRIGKKGDPASSVIAPK